MDQENKIPLEHQENAGEKKEQGRKAERKSGLFCM
jgi:hypothetical protein